MVYYWAHWLEDALRTDPFVAERLVVVGDWYDVGRPPSQFSFLPSGHVDHHTACMLQIGHDPRNCINGILGGREGAPPPISQLLGTFTPPGVKWNGSNVDPRICLLAAGRANHAGTGEYRWGAPGGNGSSIGAEWCGPPSMPWPDIVVELRARVDACILRWNGWTVDHLTIHWEYARPLGRKIDPSGPWKLEPNLSRLQHWNPDLWRGYVDTFMAAPAPPTPTPPPAPTPQPTPTPEDDDMRILQYAKGTSQWAQLVLAGGRVKWARGEAATFIDTLGLEEHDIGFGELVQLMRDFGTEGASPFDANEVGAAPDAGMDFEWKAARRN